MIDTEIKFGAFVPAVPKIYRDAASNDVSKLEHILDDSNNCCIGPKWTNLRLRSIEAHNHDTSIFEFELPDPNVLLQLPITAHMLVKAPGNDDEGEDVEHVRPYTAIEESHPGRFKIMVKRYPGEFNLTLLNIKIY